MTLEKLTPFAKKIILDWKGSKVRFEFKNPKKEPITGEIIDVDVHKAIFLIRPSNGQDALIPMGGVRIVQKVDENSPEVIPGKPRLKEYNSLPIA